MYMYVRTSFVPRPTISHYGKSGDETKCILLMKNCKYEFTVINFICGQSACACTICNVYIH